MRVFVATERLPEGRAVRRRHNRNLEFSFSKSVGEISDAFVDISPTRGEFSIEESTMQWRVSVHGTLIDFGCVVVCSWQQTHFMPRGFVLNRVV